LTAFGLRSLILIILNYNYFKYEEDFYKQLDGMAMGVICGPTLANLYLYILEIKWLNLNKPLVYLRFIDDIFLVIKDKLDIENFVKTFIYLTLNIVTDDIANFLYLYAMYPKHIKNNIKNNIK